MVLNLNTLKVESYDPSDGEPSNSDTSPVPVRNWNVTCKLCEKSVRPCNMKRHIRVAHTLNADETGSIKILSKPQQNQSKKKLKNKKIHADIDEVQGTFQTCVICGKSLFACNMKRHLKLAHKLGREELSSMEFKNKKGKKKIFNCPLCNETFEILVDLIAHYSKSHPTTADEAKVFLISEFNDTNRHWCCAICSYMSDLLYLCVQHIQKVHQDVVHRIETNINESFGCHLCQASMKPFECFIEHQKKQHKTKTPHQCNQCGEMLTSAFRLRTHVYRKHSDLRPYLCEVCGKSFKDKQSVVDHMMIHTGRKMYVCQDCGADFAYASGLRQHISLHHDKEKRLECEECGKIFKLGHHLT